VIYITPALTTFAEKITALILFFKEHKTAATLLHGTLTVLMTPLALIPTKMGEVAKGMASASEQRNWQRRQENLQRKNSRL